MKAFYRPDTSTDWIPYGYEISITGISSLGYYVGIGATSHATELASMQVSSFEVQRVCSSETITELQCTQASNCELGEASGTCYSMGEAPSWELMEPVKSIFDTGSTVTSFGCANPESGTSPNNAVDETTMKFYCDREGLANEPTGLVVVPFHGRVSLAQGLRIFAHNNCPDCDVVSYLFEGRMDSSSNWVQISAGDLPWKNATTFPRNGVLGLGISSSYSSGDSSFVYTEVSFGDPSSLQGYREYRVTWTDTRNPAQLAWQLAEIEVPGLLGEEPALPTLAYAGDYVASVVHGSTDIFLLDGYSGGNSVDKLALDGTTQKFVMYRDNATDVPGACFVEILLAIFLLFRPELSLTRTFCALFASSAMKISPSHRRASVVTGLRLYAANNNAGADPMAFRVEGRGMVAGANIQTRHSNKCLQLEYYSGDYRISLAGSCLTSEDDQLFYMNELGEIRVRSLPGYCLDPRFGLSTHYQANHMVPCNSEVYGMDSPYARWHQFTYDPSTEEFESVFYPGHCVEYMINSGWLSLDECDGKNNQKFYVGGGAFDSSTDEGWVLVEEGRLPWFSSFDRNPLGVGITSSYVAGDAGRFYREVKFYESTAPYDEYKVSFPETRDPASLMVQFGELELPGLLLEEEVAR